jgi:type II secretory pathway component PulC
MTSPIQVEDCKTPYVGGLLLAETIEKFTIVFTNEGSVTADLVRFEIHLGQEDIFIRDVGKFEPGITVTHVFRKRGGNVVTSPLFAPAPFYCGVASAHFIDGTDWTPSSPPNVSSTALLPAPAQTPLPLSGNGYIGLVLQQTDAGVVVHLVLPGAPAEQAGIHQGDLIFQIDRQRAATVADAITLISATPPGTKLSIMVIRDGTQQTLNAIVAARPPTAQGP